MIAGSHEILDNALEILKALLAGGEVSNKKNTHLYEKYRYNTEVEEMLVYIAEKLELRVYSDNDRLFVCPQAGSKLFGWSNSELRNRISYINNNSELFTCYFIIITLVTMFYREVYPYTAVAYIRFNDLVESVTKRIENLMKVEDLEEVSVKNQFAFEDICRVWQRLPDAREGVTSGKNDKIVFVENVLRFLADEKLILFDMKQRIIYPAERFKTIIWNYYEDRDNRRDLLLFIKDLEVSD